MEVNFGIKRPQMIGIIAGCIVFSLTIMTVVVLLFKSGTMQGFFEQMKREADEVKAGEKDGRKPPRQPRGLGRIAASLLRTIHGVGDLRRWGGKPG